MDYISLTLCVTVYSKYNYNVPALAISMHSCICFSKAPPVINSPGNIISHIYPENAQEAQSFHLSDFLLV